MLTRFKQYLIQVLQLPEKASILAAVSGGIDSVVMLHLLIEAGYKPAIAHANFQLRGLESDRDEAFVQNLAREFDIPCFVKRFDTAAEMKSAGISAQMAARKLRYNWFEELATDEGYDYIAVAHHLDDQIETFFINLLRGTGISGLHGIVAKQGKIIRPMLFAFRSDILNYANEYKLMFVEDSSNRSTDYLRNQLRHQVLPVLNEIRPSFRRVMESNMQHLADAEAFLKKYLDIEKNALTKQNEDELWISVNQLKEKSHASFILHELLSGYGFNSSTVQQIFLALDGLSGKVFFSPSHQVLKDRDWLIVSPIVKYPEQSTEYVIGPETTETVMPLRLEIQVFPKNGEFSINPDPSIAFLDFDTLQFPLTLRHWKTGDRFAPLGMKGSMKLSDYFVSKSYSLNQKKTTWILADANGDIIWLIGQRISDRCRIRPTTTTVCRIQHIQP